MFEFLLWKDHAVSPSNTYKLTKNNDDTYTLTPVGKVIQQGTNMSAANFNRMEVGLHDVNIAVKIAQIIIQRLGRRADKLESRADGHDTSIANINTLDGQQNSRLSTLEPEVAAEVKEVALTAGNDPWPFCAKDTAVGLSTTRKNTNYTVDVTVKSYTGGRLGDITVKDKLANGFKLHHDGSATSVVVSVVIKGGMK